MNIFQCMMADIAKVVSFVPEAAKTGIVYGIVMLFFCLAVPAKEKAARRNEYGRGDGNGLPVVAAPVGAVARKYSFCNLFSGAATDGIS